MSTTVQKPDQPPECECCGWVTAELTFSNPRPWMTAEKLGGGGLRAGWLCEICRSTWAGTAFSYPKIYPESNVGSVLATVAWGINRILAEIRKEAI